MGLKFYLILLAFGILQIQTIQAQECIVFGMYNIKPTVSYNCAFDVIMFNYTSFRFINMGNGNIKVVGMQIGTVPELIGSINCDDSTFNVGAMLVGGCTETYNLQGHFESDTAWSGTLKVQFSGTDCFDCTNQTYALIGSTDRITEITTTLITVEYSLHQNFPNPFNPVTKIKYELPNKSFVILKVYDVLGNEVKTLINKEKPSGNHEIEFNGSGVTSGIYFYKLQAGEFVETKKMVFLR